MGFFFAFIAFLGALALVGYAIDGIVWFFVHYWPLVAVVATVGLVVALFYSRGNRAVKNVQVAQLSRDIKKIEVVRRDAQRSANFFSENRVVLQRKASELVDLRHTLAGDINFRLLAQRHFESLKLADKWHVQKNQAILTKKEFSSGLAQFKQHKSVLLGDRQSSNSNKRSRLTREIDSAQAVVNDLYAALSTFEQEISRGSDALDQYNHETGLLRDHIGENCGPRGRRWYNELQERKRNKH